jgi:hypothetical protein
MVRYFLLLGSGLVMALAQHAGIVGVQVIAASSHMLQNKVISQKYTYPSTGCDNIFIRVHTRVNRLPLLLLVAMLIS